jgi:hypothetical protein
MDKVTFLKWWLMSLTTGLGAWFGYKFGLYEIIAAADKTYISFSILGMFSVSSIWAGWKSWLFSYRDEFTETKNAWFVSDMYLALGLMGTIIGFIMMLGGSLEGLNVANQSTIMVAMIKMANGMSTALWTTLTGIVCSWLLKIQLVNLDHGINNYEGT